MKKWHQYQSSEWSNNQNQNIADIEYAYNVQTPKMSEFLKHGSYSGMVVIKALNLHKRGLRKLYLQC